MRAGILKIFFAIACIPLLLLGCSNGGHDVWEEVKPILSDKPAWGENGVYDPELVHWYPPEEEFWIRWQPIESDVPINYFIYANQILTRDPLRLTLIWVDETTEPELYMDYELLELVTGGRFAIGVEAVRLDSDGVEVGSGINWSDQISYQGAVGLWGIADRDIPERPIKLERIAGG